MFIRVLETECNDGGKPGRSARNGQMAGRDGKVSTRPVTTHRETAAKGYNNLCCI